MLDTQTKNRINDCRDILVGKLPDPKAQIEQITIALIYKFMDDMDKEAIELGGTAKFFSGDYEKFSWDNLFNTKVTAAEMLRLYSEALMSMDKNPSIPQLFRDIFKNAYLPYRDPETLKLFLKTIGGFEYTHSEKLGDAFEFLLSVMGSQGDAGQFRTPRHIIDFLVKIVDPGKNDKILDPACGTSGFLISAFKHIKEQNNDELTPDERKRLLQNFTGYDISPDMVRLSLVNLYLHGFPSPHIYEYDTLSSEERWGETYDCILANPPFMSPKGGIRPHKKFSISSNRSEVLFVDYIAEHLNPKGKAGIIVPEGVIFKNDSGYKALRKMLVDNYLYAVVSLPAGIFNPYSGVKTSILLMDKELAKTRDEILFVKIDNDGFNLGAQRNAVKGSQLDEAVEIIHAFAKGDALKESLSSIAHKVARKEIGKSGDYNLSGERYRNKQELEKSTYSTIEIGEIIDFQYGKPLKKEDRIEGDYPVYGSNGIVGFHNEFIAKAPFIVVGRKGSAGALHYSEKPGYPIDTTFFIEDRRPEKIKIKYAYHILGTLNLDKLNVQAGIPGLNRNDAYKLHIPLPPLSVQEEIVAEIESYQKIIDGAKAVVENYKPKIDIDPSWQMVELGEIAKPQYGFTDTAKDEGEVRFIRITDIGTDGKLIGSNPKYTRLTAESAKYLINRNDILLARTGATYGKTMIYEDDAPAIFASFLMRLNLDQTKIYPKYYWAFAQSDSYITQAASLMTGGGQPQFNGNAVVKIKLPLPPLSLQREIVDQIEKEQELVNANKQLIQIFEKKIKGRIAKVWGKEQEEEEEVLSMAAEEEVEYGKLG